MLGLGFDALLLSYEAAGKALKKHPANVGSAGG
jgi:hypothetical protein